MTKRLTALAVENARAAPSRREISDGGGGLYLVVQPSGAKSWALRYRVAGRPVKHTIGPFPAIDLAAARKLAKQAAGKIASGGNPHGEKVARRAAQAAAARAERDMIENVVANFIERHAKKHTRRGTAYETARILNKEVVEPWKGRRLDEIRKRDVLELVNGIVDRGAPITANRTLAKIRRLFSWAIEQDLIVGPSPAAGVKPPSAEITRDRVLDDNELAAIWHAADDDRFGALVRLLILTGQRRSEVAGMRWSEIDLNAKTWTIPRERAKNGRENVVPLSDGAIAILARLPRGVGDAALRVTTGFSRGKERLDRAVLGWLRKADPDAKPLAPWVLHDLRRTMASGLAAHGVAIHVVEKLLNHATGAISAIGAIYNRHDYAKEQRAALDGWAAHVEAITTGAPAPSNVLEFAPPARS